MFENIFHQHGVRESLTHEIASGSLPRAMLFAGPEFSAKLSAALELVRVVSCKNPKAPWSCSCASCAQQRYLTSPYLLLMGRRDFQKDIRGALDTLRRADTEASRFLVLRSVRKLTRRFDPVLWEGDSKLSQAAKQIEKMEELLEVVGPPCSEERKARLAAEFPGDDVLKCAAALGKLLPQDGVNVAMIRHAAYWAHTADASQPKFVIIERAEFLNDSARNSLLKILEEPPESVYFLLTSLNREAILPTLLSRLRTYRFERRTLVQEEEVLKTIFRLDADHPLAKKGLGAYMASVRSGSDEVEALALSFASLLVARCGLDFLLETNVRDQGMPKIDLEKTDAEHFFHVLRGSIQNRFAQLGRPELSPFYLARNLDVVAAADAVTRLSESVSRAWHAVHVLNVAATNAIEQVYWEAGAGPCVDSFKGH